MGTSPLSRDGETSGMPSPRTGTRTGADLSVSSPSAGVEVGRVGIGRRRPAGTLSLSPAGAPRAAGESTSALDYQIVRADRACVEPPVGGVLSGVSRAPRTASRPVAGDARLKGER